MQSNKNIGNMRIKTLQKIFILFFVPAIVMLGVFTAVNVYYVKYFEDEVRDNYTKRMNEISGRIGGSFEEMYQTILMISGDRNFKEIMWNSSKSLNISEVSNCITLLNRFCMTNKLIDSAFIYDKASGMVISNTTTSYGESYFDRDNVYELYPLSFWNGIELKLNELAVLKVSTASSYGEKTRTLIPVVIQGIEGIKTDNIFVVNLKEEVLKDLLRSNEITPRSSLFIADSSGEMISYTDKIIADSILSDINVLETIKGVGSSKNLNNSTKDIRMIHDFYIKGKNHMLFLMPFNIISKRLIITITVPREDILLKATRLRSLTLIVSLGGLALQLMISLWMSNKIYRPFKGIADVIRKDSIQNEINDDSRDEFDFIKNSISGIISSKQSLEESLEIALPLACEQYMRTMLESNETYIGEDIKNFLQRYGVSFKHERYSAMVFQYKFSELFNQSFNKQEQHNIKNSIKNVIMYLMPNEVQGSIFEIGKNRICCILSMPDSITIENINQSLIDIKSVFDYDQKLVDIFCGVGRIYTNLQGMQTSYREALNAVSQLSPMIDDRVKIYEESEKEMNYHYTIEDENRLYNYISVGYMDKANELITEIIQKNNKFNISASDKSELYVQLYNTGVRVLSGKNTSPMDLMEDQYVNLPLEYRNMTPEEVFEYVMELFERITEVKKDINIKVEIKEITDYINDNFYRDIYLEHLAERFNTNSKYISKIFKIAHGVNYHDYLTSIRVSKAKELLIETNKSISSIYEACGFTNRSTFIRVFKSLEGVTPSQYREINGGEK